MGPFPHGFPYSDLHDLNLDWCISTVKRLEGLVPEQWHSFVVYVQDGDGNPIYTFSVTDNGIYITDPYGNTPFFYNFSTGMLHAAQLDGTDVTAGTVKVYAPNGMKLTNGNYHMVGNFYWDSNQFYFDSNPEGETYKETFKLPAFTTGRGSDGTFAILTNKSPVTIAQGGTGATSASGARSALGAVNIAGDTMSGNLNAPSFTAYNASYPSLYFNDTSNAIARILVNHSTHSMSMRLVKTSGHFDSYALPTPNIAETSDEYYYFLTTKSAVTVAQGGTGATAQSAITLTPGNNVTVNHNSSKVWGNLVVLTFDITVSSALSNGETIVTMSGVTAGSEQVHVPLVKVTASGVNGTGKIYANDLRIVAGGSLAAGDYIVTSTYIKS